MLWYRDMDQHLLEFDGLFEAGSRVRVQMIELVLDVAVRVKRFLVGGFQFYENGLDLFGTLVKETVGRLVDYLLRTFALV